MGEEHELPVYSMPVISAPVTPEMIGCEDLEDMIRTTAALHSDRFRVRFDGRAFYLVCTACGEELKFLEIDPSKADAPIIEAVTWRAEPEEMTKFIKRHMGRH